MSRFAIWDYGLRLVAWRTRRSMQGQAQSVKKQDLKRRAPALDDSEQAKAAKRSGDSSDEDEEASASRFAA
eukprot:14367392-Alexandrium_andersonii.AAC.1